MLVFEYPELDLRLIKWPLMESVRNTVFIIMAYLVFVKIIGPEWMSRRKPYQLRMPMIIYNFGMVALSTWMFYKFGKHGWFYKYNWTCAPVHFSEDDDSMQMARISYYFYISKLIELSDTIFFVLRKKRSQVTGLHIVHHALVPFTSRYALTHGAAGYNILFGFLNCFAHIWMYLYYALASLGPGMQKYLWWKKYITTIQLVQFCIEFFFMVLHCVHPRCNANVILILLNLGQAVFFFVLFAKFYASSYSKKKLKTDLPSEGVQTPVEKNGNGVHHRSNTAVTLKQ